MYLDLRNQRNVHRSPPLVSWLPAGIQRSGLTRQFSCVTPKSLICCISNSPRILTVHLSAVQTRALAEGRVECGATLRYWYVFDQSLRTTLTCQRGGQRLDGAVQANCLDLDANDLNMLQLLEYMIEHPVLGAAIHARADGVPIAESLGQPAPFATVLDHILIRLLVFERSRIRPSQE